MTSVSSSCEIYFVRHGETDWNLQDRIQGHTDIPLNATGISQALELREILSEIPFSAAFSSDLSRAEQTAQLILNPRVLTISSSLALRERSAGALEGLLKESFEEKILPFFTSEKALHQESYMRTPWHPELETSHSVLKRVSSFLFPLATHYSGKTILIVSHGGVLRSILDYLVFTPKKRWVVDNCGFIKIRVDQNQLQLLDCHRVSSKQI